MKMGATNGQRLRTRSHVRNDDDLRPLLQLAAEVVDPREPPAALRHSGGGGESIWTGLRLSTVSVNWISKQGREKVSAWAREKDGDDHERGVLHLSFYRRGGLRPRGMHQPQMVPPHLPSWFLVESPLTHNQVALSPIEFPLKNQEFPIKTILIHLV